jgi:hypothetical protein
VRFIEKLPELDFSTRGLRLPILEGLGADVNELRMDSGIVMMFGGRASGVPAFKSPNFKAQLG